MPKEQDAQYTEQQIAAVRQEQSGGWSITFKDGFSLGVPANSPIVPKPGMLAREYGEGIGFPVRGLDINGVQVWYKTPEEQDAEHAAFAAKCKEDEQARADAITKSGAMTEAAMRDAEVPWPKTEEELVAYIRKMIDRPHDYGTCVYAMSMASVATYYYVSHVLGVTGFQASCADMDFVRRTRHMESGFQIVDYEDLLYPQNLDDDHFPSRHQLIRDNIKQLAKSAQKKLAEAPQAHADVRRHWQNLVGMYEQQEQHNERHWPPMG